MNKETKETKTEVALALKDFPKAYANFLLTEAQIGFYRQINMPRQKARMFSFAVQKNLTNEVINHYATLSSERGAKEKFEDYKNRCKFQTAIMKYRKFLLTPAQPVILQSGE